MLHDPGSYSEPKIFESIELKENEKTVLRELGATIASIAALGVHKEKAELWRAMNDLESKRPMVWINEIPWHEMNVNDELTLRCEHPWARDLETTLRRTIYQWNHMRGDMVINDYIACPLVIHSTDFGIHEEVDVARTDDQNDIYSRHFHIQIEKMADVEKIKMPKVIHYEKATEASFHTMQELFKDIIDVRKEGQTHIWFTPWDYLIRWTGVQEAMIALVDDPDMVNAAVERMVDAWMVELDQFVEQNLLSLDCNNTRIGSGGYGYTSRLPGKPFDKDRVLPHNMWGCSNAQIFSEVSPDMHWEFAMRHDFRWLERWGMTYYGCCEPMQNKVHLLKKIPNLRKVSVSPWNNYQKILPALGGDYVASIKPNPAIFAEEGWNPKGAMETLQSALDAAEGKGHIEFIMKDISTVRYRPQLLWQWSELAMQLVEG
ncbi:MAG: hypothetical protein JXK93_13160 [Sphaerochaetaceae bacterium]|nr:hypothetical protein [Sphaerochaetaceae bacterium]